MQMMFEENGNGSLKKNRKSHSEINVWSTAPSKLDFLIWVVNQHAPLRPQTRKEFELSTKPWLSKGILKSIQAKNALFTKCYKKNDPVLIEKYKKYSNKLTTIKRIAKQNYYAKMIQSNKNNLSNNGN